MIKVDIDELYAFVLLMAVLILIECWLIGLLVTDKPRKVFFSKEFLVGNFGGEHEAAFGPGT